MRVFRSIFVLLLVGLGIAGVVYLGFIFKMPEMGVEKFEYVGENVITMQVDDEIHLNEKVVVKPINLERLVKYTVVDGLDILKVYADGRVIAKKEGESTIQVKLEEKVFQIKIEVKAIPIYANNQRFENDNVSIKIEETGINQILDLGGYNQGVDCEYNKEIISYDAKNGELVAKKVGETTVVVRLKKSGNIGDYLTISFRVEVLPKIAESTNRLDLVEDKKIRSVYFFKVQLYMNNNLVILPNDFEIIFKWGNCPVEESLLPKLSIADITGENTFKVVLPNGIFGKYELTVKIKKGNFSIENNITFNYVE